MLNALFAQTIVLSNKGAAAHNFLANNRAHDSSRDQPVHLVVHSILVHLAVYGIAINLAIHSLAFLLAH